MDLDELAVGVPRPLAIAAGRGGAGAHHGVGALPEDEAAAAGGHDHRVGAEGPDLHGAEVLGHDALAIAGVVDDRPQELPVLVLGDLAFALVAADLLVEGVDQLLAGGRAREVGPLVERAAEEAEVALAFGGAVEGHAHPVEEVDDLRGPVGHLVDRRLVGEEVAAVDRLVEVLELGVALLAGHLVAGVDAALGADGVGSLHRDHREEVDRNARFGDANGAGEAGEPAAYHDDSTLRIHDWADRGLGWRTVAISGPRRGSTGLRFPSPSARRGWRSPPPP